MDIDSYPDEELPCSSRNCKKVRKGRCGKKCPVGLQSHVLNGFGKVVLVLGKKFKVAASQMEQTK